MSLTLIATPIGNLEDITLRALKKLESSEFIIGEEIKVVRRRLSSWGIKPQDKKIYALNEHSSAEDLKELLKVCSDHDVCLVTDCGTPSFFDPGFALVRLITKTGIELKSLPGVSSLTALMPYLDKKTENFTVEGFPPQKDHERNEFFKKLSKTSKPFFLMDTPYRLKRTFEDLNKFLPESYCVAGLSLTEETERVLRGKPSEILSQVTGKENFVCMVYL